MRQNQPSHHFKLSCLNDPYWTSWGSFLTWYARKLTSRLEIRHGFRRQRQVAMLLRHRNGFFQRWNLFGTCHLWLVLQCGWHDLLPLVSFQSMLLLLVIYFAVTRKTMMISAAFHNRIFWFAFFCGREKKCRRIDANRSMRTAKHDDGCAGSKIAIKSKSTSKKGIWNFARRMCKCAETVPARVVHTLYYYYYYVECVVRFIHAMTRIKKGRKIFGSL